MKKLILSVMMVCAIAPSFYAQKLKGSDTVLPLAQKEAEVFGKKTGKSVTVIGGGSGVGIAALINGSTDITDNKIEQVFDLKKIGNIYKISDDDVIVNFIKQLYNEIRTFYIL